MACSSHPIRLIARNKDWAIPQRMIEDMDPVSVDKAVLLCESQQSRENFVARKNQALEISKRWPDLHPLRRRSAHGGRKALDKVQRCLNGEMQGTSECGIPWQDSPVPFSEPIVQAAATHDYGSVAQHKLLQELNKAIRGTGTDHAAS